MSTSSRRTFAQSYYLLVKDLQTLQLSNHRYIELKIIKQLLPEDIEDISSPALGYLALKYFWYWLMTQRLNNPFPRPKRPSATQTIHNYLGSPVKKGSGPKINCWLIPYKKKLKELKNKPKAIAKFWFMVLHLPAMNTVADLTIVLARKTRVDWESLKW